MEIVNGVCWPQILKFEHWILLWEGCICTWRKVNRLCYVVDGVVEERRRLGSFCFRNLEMSGKTKMR